MMIDLSDEELVALVRWHEDSAGRMRGGDYEDSAGAAWHEQRAVDLRLSRLTLPPAAAHMA